MAATIPKVVSGREASMTEASSKKFILTQGDGNQFSLIYKPLELRCQFKLGSKLKSIPITIEKSNRTFTITLKPYGKFPDDELKNLKAQEFGDEEKAKQFLLDLRDEIFALKEQPMVQTRKDLSKTPIIETTVRDLRLHVNEYVRFKAKVMSTIHGVTNDGLREKFLLYLDPEDDSEAIQPRVIYTRERSANLAPQGLAQITGVVKVDPAKDDFAPAAVYVEAESVENAEEDFMNYRPTAEDFTLFRKYFGSLNAETLVPTIDKTLAPYIVGRELEKVFYVLTGYTPIQLPYEGKRIFGITLLAAGDPRESKSALGKDLVYNLCPKGAIRVNAETARKTGLISTTVKDPKTEQWTTKWGKLPQADRALVFLDGVSSMPEDLISQLREALSERMAESTKAHIATRPMRIRLIMAGNSRRDVDEYYCKLDACKDVGSKDLVIFEQSADWCRVHIPLCFGEKDVEYAKKDGALIHSTKIERAIPAEVFKKAVAYVWQREPEDYEVEPQVREVIGQKLAELRKLYGYVDVALFKSEGLHIFTSYVYAVAGFFLNLTKEGKIRVTLDHVEIMDDLFQQLFDKLGFVKAVEKESFLEAKAQRVCNKADPAWTGITEKEDAAMSVLTSAMFFLFQHGAMNGKRLINDFMKISKYAFYQQMKLAELMIQKRFGDDTPDLIEGTTGAGFKLTDFGIKVMQHMKALGRI